MKFQPNCLPLEDRTVPATLRVSSLLDNTILNDGTVTLREAIIAANSNTTTDLGDTGSGTDTIIFVGAAAGGTIALTQETVVGEVGLPIISSNITIQGEQGKNITLTNSQQVSGNRIFSVGGGAALNLSYVTFTRTPGNQQNQFSATTSAVFVAADGVLKVTDSMFLNNSVATGLNGGAISNSGTLTIDRSTFTQSIARNGGAIFNNGQATVSSSTFFKNSTEAGDPPGMGAGIFNSGILTVLNSTFAENSAGFGGGIYTNGDLTLVNDSFVKNNTVGNITPPVVNPGSAVYAVRKAASPTVEPKIKIQNTLFSGNYYTPPGQTVPSNFYSDNVALDSSSNHNLLGEVEFTSGIENGVNGNIVGSDPLLGPLANNGGPTATYALGQNSPAIGKGTNFRFGLNNGIPASVYDQRGVARDVFESDIGAYEVHHPLATVGTPISFGHLYAPKPSASANEAFVKGLYQSTLLRAPDSAGLTGWLNALSGGTTRSAVANGFVNSVENRTAQVTNFYRAFLKREPEAAGLNFWVDSLRGGTDEGVVMSSFILSPEFSAGNNNTQFATLMYSAILGREADTTGLNGWVNALDSGTSRGEVLNAFLRSDEGLLRVESSFYYQYLIRAGDTDGLAANKAFLSNHTFGQLAVALLASDEFYSNAGANV